MRRSIALVPVLLLLLAAQAHARSAYVVDTNGDHKADLVSATPVHVVSFTAAGDIKEDVYVWKLQTRLGQGDGTFSDSVATDFLPPHAKTLPRAGHAVRKA